MTWRVLYDVAVRLVSWGLECRGIRFRSRVVRVYLLVFEADLAYLLLKDV